MLTSEPMRVSLEKNDKEKYKWALLNLAFFFFFVCQRSAYLDRRIDAIVAYYNYKKLNGSNQVVEQCIFDIDNGWVNRCYLSLLTFQFGFSMTEAAAE